MQIQNSDGRPRRRHGEVTGMVEQWIANYPAGVDFHYGEIADELDVPRPTISNIVLKMARKENPTVLHGRRAGAFRRVEPAAPERKLPAMPRYTEIPVNTGKPNSSGELLEVIGTMKSGELLLRSEDGRSLWRATEM